MEINIKKLISIEKVLKNTKDVLEMVEQDGKVIILKDNEPAYVLCKYNEVNINGTCDK